MATTFSSLGEFRYFFECIKLLGIFPFLIEYDTRGSNRRVKYISFHKSGVYYWLNQLTVGLYLAQLIFLISNLYIHLMREQTPDTIINGSWICSASLFGTMLLSFHLRKNRFCRFFNQWILVEEAIKEGKLNLIRLNILIES